MQWNRNYPFIVWISTLLLGTIVYFTAFTGHFQADLTAAFQISFFFFFLGLLFSAPAFMIYLLLFKFLLRDNLPTFATKVLSCLIAIATLAFTLFIISRGKSDTDAIKFILAYSTPIVLSSFAFKLKKSRPSF